MCRPDDYPPHAEPSPAVAALRDRLHARRARQQARNADRYMEALAAARELRHAAYGSPWTVILPGRRHGPAHGDERAYDIPADQLALWRELARGALTHDHVDR